MTPALLPYLCDPVDRSPLALREAQEGADGSIVSGVLVSGSGRSYSIRNGIPRFADDAAQTDVASFGDEWNHFNFDDYRVNWADYLPAAAAASSRAGFTRPARSMSSAWSSPTVDDVVPRNLGGVTGVDVIQCSIDQPPLRDGSIDGIVICHNVIQHTRSVEQTARALWRLVAPGGEFVFNCSRKTIRASGENGDSRCMKRCAVFLSAGRSGFASTTRG